MSLLVSIHTPSWNRANYLEKVWAGLCAQTYTNFEWIVSDDGSTDNTKEILQKIKMQSSFPVILVSASIRVGKTVLDNNAIKIANGDFFVWNDSDDVFLPNAIECLVEAWESIPKSDRLKYVGITALCTANKKLSYNLPFLGVFDTTWNELRMVYKVKGDMIYFCKTEILKNNLFPEVDYYMPESVVWTAIGDSFMTRVIPEILMVKEYNSINAISFVNEIKYCRGYAYSLAMSKKNLLSYNQSLMDSLWEDITYMRYCIHGEVSFREAIKLIKNNTSIVLLALLFPISIMLVIKDNFQSKVIKTHRDFVSHRKIAKIIVNK